ncbi:kunitz-type serine protease inhibitor A-like [Rhipicephalus microplus]|uniref:kunitz-type serine protease inhibitor A-like n=1 Tax=Rhipicephalus microplus TaxID=6941 RepID=UPI003F6A7B02
MLETGTFVLILSTFSFVLGLPKGCLVVPRMSRCGLPKPRWYYNATSQRCQPVLWGGCGYKGNVFTSHAECDRRCGGSYQASTDRCLIVPRKQNCSNGKAQVLMWRFHKNSMTCISEYYNGCGGHGNLYRTCTMCYQDCILHTFKLPICTDNPPRGPPIPQRPGRFIPRRPKV